MMPSTMLGYALMASAAAHSYDLPAIVQSTGGDIAPKRHTGGAAARRQAKKRRNVRARSKKK